jgi:hypothetical protein
MSKKEKQLLIALAWMYEQYCGDNFGHDFMSAGEGAIELLENYGLGNEKDGVFINKVEELERNV